MSYVPEIQVLIAYLAAVLVIAITPGPDMTFFVSRAISQGTKSGLAAMLGAISGIMVHTCLVAFGLAALIVASPTLFAGLKITGALYLAYLAFQAVRQGSAFTVKAERARGRSLTKDYLQGLWINLLNPKIILFFMTFLPQFVSASDPDAVGKLFFLGGVFVLAALPVVVPIILLASRFAQWMKENAKVTRAIDYLFAGVFGAFAIRILLVDRA